MQMSIKENGKLVQISGVSSYPGFKLTGLYCMSNYGSKQIQYMILIFSAHSTKF